MRRLAALLGFLLASSALAQVPPGGGGISTIAAGTNVTISPSSPCSAGICTISATGSPVSITAGNAGIGVSPSPLTGTGTISLEAPSATTLGGIESIAATSHEWINAISTLGVPSQTQPACGDLSNSGTACQANTGTSGTTVPMLSTANTWSLAQTFTSGLTTPDTSNGAITLGASTANAPVTISTNTATTLPSVVSGTVVEIAAVDNGSAQLELDSFGTSPSRYLARTAGGTGASPTALPSGTALFQFIGSGYDGSAYSGVGNNSAFLINAVASSTWSTANHGTQVQLYDTLDQAIVRHLSLELNGLSGNVEASDPITEASTATPTLGTSNLLAFSGSSTAPTFGANAQGAGWLSGTLGYVDGGQGSTNDRTFTNKSGSTVIAIPTGTTNVKITTALALGGTTVEASGINSPTYWANGTQGLASKSCAFTTANVATGITLTITEGLITATTTC